MLVLNRRQGEAILVEGGIAVCVLSARGPGVWLRIDPANYPRLVLGVAVHSPETMRLEIAAPSSYLLDARGIHVEVAGMDHRATIARATVSFLCGPDDRVFVGNHLELAVSPSGREHPNLVLGGAAIGEELRLALIRPMGNCIRIGVDAPGRRVYRKELWEALSAENTAAAEGIADLSSSSAEEQSTKECVASLR